MEWNDLLLELEQEGQRQLELDNGAGDGKENRPDNARPGSSPLPKAPSPAKPTNRQIVSEPGRIHFGEGKGVASLGELNSVRPQHATGAVRRKGFAEAGQGSQVQRLTGLRVSGV